MTNDMTPEAIYMGIRHLIQTMPNFVANPTAFETQKWLGKLYAFVQVLTEMSDLIDLRAETNILNDFPSSLDGAIRRREKATRKIQTITYRALAVAELRAPTSVQESFIPAGADFDAFAIISKVFGKAKAEILIVDPYLNEKVFTDFMLAIPEGVTARLLASEINHKRGILQPAFSRWAKQYSSIRPTELRVVSDKGLHDRLIIIDSTEVWLLSQSFNAFAERASASIVRSQDPELKIEAYNDIWENAQPIQP